LSQLRYAPKQILAIRDFDIPHWSDVLTNNFEDELSHGMGENPQLKEKYLCPYIEGVEFPREPFLTLWWFKDDQIDDLLKIENHEELRIFPRYIHKISEIENIEQFCWENHLYLNRLIKQKKEAEENIDKLKEIAKQQNTSLQEILDANFGVTTPEMVEFMINQYVENEKERKVKLSANFVEILTDKPSPFELPIFNLSSYEFLWKTPHPFEDKGVPRSLVDVDPAQFKKPKKTFEFDKIASEARGYFEKGYGLNFIGENYETFIKEYIELAQSSYFSYALVWELKEKYLKLLHEQMHKEDRSKARYAFYSEGPTWTITFDGKTLRGLRGKGFEYLHYLVLNKHKKLYHSELQQLGSTSENDFNDPNKLINLPIDFEEGDEKKDSDFDQIIKRDIPIEMLDKRSFDELNDERNRLRKEVEEAKKNNDLVRKEKAEKEFEEFSSYLVECFGKKDINKKARIRIFKDGTKKTKDNIAVNINRALDRIKKDSLITRNHFKKALGSLYSDQLSYRPIEDIDWNT